jgi:uncharacterized protein YecT (DUF1311 family)
MLLAGTAAQAAPGLYPVEDCNREETQSGLNACVGANFEAADRALGETYRRLLARLDDPAARARLERSERRFLAARDRDCARKVGPREGSGSIWPMDLASCLEEKTAARLRALHRELE